MGSVTESVRPGFNLRSPVYKANSARSQIFVTFRFYQILLQQNMSLAELLEKAIWPSSFVYLVKLSK